MRSFKKVLKASAIFLALTVLLTAIIVYPYFHGETYHYQDAYVRQSLAGQLDLLICGASQAQSGIDPRVLDEKLGCNSYNLASPLLTLKSRYELMEKELARNPVDTVLVEICCDSMYYDRDQVGPEGEYYMLGRLNQPMEIAEFLLTHVRAGEGTDFYSDLLVRGMTAWKTRLRGGGAIGTSENYETKGFVPREAQAIESPEPSEYFKSAPGLKQQEENLLYFEKLLALCKENHVKTIIVSTPLPNGTLLRYGNLDEIQAQYLEISERWGCEFYNGNLYKGKTALFSDDTDYYDIGHLSATGAETFTELIASLMQRRADGEDLSDLFYTTYDELFQTEILQ